MAHGDFELLRVLISMLDDARNDIYLHVDSKAKDFDPSDFTTTHAGLFMQERRMDVRWGHVSQVRLELYLFEYAYRRGPYSYYHLLSGADLPIKSQDYIHDFFDQHQGREFVGFWHDNDWQAEMRVSHYYFLMRYERINNRFLSIIASKIRDLIWRIAPLRPLGEIQFKKGPNWVSITHDFCGYLVAQKDWILHRFKYTRSGDEIFLQTVIWNSPFRDSLYDPDDVDAGCMREIDWSRGTNTSPYIWRLEDYGYLASSEKIFARKFSMQVDCMIVDTLRGV